MNSIPVYKLLKLSPSDNSDDIIYKVIYVPCACYPNQSKFAIVSALTHKSQVQYDRREDGRHSLVGRSVTARDTNIINAIHFFLLL